MGHPSTVTFTAAQRRIALAWGIACHLSFAAGVAAMIAGLWSGMTIGLGPFRGGSAFAFDVLLLAQFPILHSILLSSRGRRWIARLAPLDLGPSLATTTFATIASWQLLATFLLWSPIGSIWSAAGSSSGESWRWSPHGSALIAMSAVYAASWLLLLKTMSDAGLGVQTGYLGWGAVRRG